MTVPHVPVSPVSEFADRAWDDFLGLNPLWATLQGDDRWDDRLDDPGPEGRARELATLDGWEQEAARLDDGRLSVEDRITLDLVNIVVRLRRSTLEHRLWQMEAIDQYNGPQSLPSDLVRFQRLHGPERLERLMARLAAFPSWLDAHASNLAVGVREGRTAAAPVLERCLTQTRRMVETPAADSPLVAAAVAAGADDAAREALVALLEREVLPAQARYLEMLEAYRPHARAGEGICWLPDGAELYRHAILAWTTLQEEPEAIHEYGLARLGEIEVQESAIARRLGFADIATLRDFLDSDPSNHATGGHQLLSAAETQMARAQEAAPRWFSRLPRAGCEIRAVETHMEEEAPPAFYMPPSSDGSRSGVYYVNTFDPASRHLHRLASTTFHEAIPGHHFQIAIEQELHDLPAFRRFGARLAGGAYAEGWGLYAERLAHEMGLYEGDRESFGALESEAWRAVRLVVDTGIHALGWTRQQSIDMLRQRAGLSQLEAETETDRYICWPGQALSYMIGQREILSLRADLQARDGDRFDLVSFHAEVLGHGSLPLATLRSRLPDWVKPRSG